MNDRAKRTAIWLAAVAVAGLLLAGCPPKEEAPAPEETTPAQKAAPPQTRTDLATVALNTSLVPSPTEVQEAMLHAGVGIRFDTLVQRRTMDLSADRETVALRTGIVLAQLVLTLNHSEKDVLLADLENLRLGLKTIGGGDDVDATIGQIAEHVQADAVTRQELWVQVEEMREAAYGELAMEAGSQMVPLVQAGSWLEGTCLLSAAIIQSEEWGNAYNLLRQPDVVGYFLAQLKSADAEGVEFPMITLTRGTLEQIHDIAKKDALEEQDVRQVHDLANTLLNQLAG